ncbi:hypothetical protein HPG69_002814 [Diceros bicornis minor]|uniref:Uncharacterized protein n=1 Tax=Diceros bicornis minor TaxID=77932 RepID=A0A7J7ER77_DICBM|nr:hypothetical protein HPG69_002814 [Diceros bicornis minor]
MGRPGPLTTDESNPRADGHPQSPETSLGGLPQSAARRSSRSWSSQLQQGQSSLWWAWVANTAQSGRRCGSAARRGAPPPGSRPRKRSRKSRGELSGEEEEGQRQREERVLRRDNKNIGPEFGSSVIQKVSRKLDTATSLSWTAGQRNDFFGAGDKHQLRFSARVNTCSLMGGSYTCYDERSKRGVQTEDNGHVNVKAVGRVVLGSDSDLLGSRSMTRHACIVGSRGQRYNWCIPKADRKYRLRREPTTLVQNSVSTTKKTFLIRKLQFGCTAS